jgi:hypothetical protein
MPTVDDAPEVLRAVVRDLVRLQCATKFESCVQSRR